MGVAWEEHPESEEREERDQCRGGALGAGASAPVRREPAALCVTI